MSSDVLYLRIDPYQEGHTHSTSRLSKYGNHIWVSSKAVNVLLDPPQSLYLVQQAKVPWHMLIPSAG